MNEEVLTNGRLKSGAQLHEELFFFFQYIEWRFMI